MTEKLRSFVVVMNFAPPGVLRLGSYIAPDEASAAALCAIDAAHTMRHIDPYPPLSNCLVVEETAEMLRHRLRAIEGKPAGDFISLVRDDTAVEEYLRAAPRAAVEAVASGMPIQDARRIWRPDDPCDPVA
jgi:hypothetical protein